MVRTFSAKPGNESPRRKQTGYHDGFSFYFSPQGAGDLTQREKLKKLLDNSRPCRDNYTHVGLFLLEAPLNISRFC